MKFVVSAGGTGGHIMPAVSIAQELIKRGHEVLYIGNKNSMEEKIVAKKDINFAAINVQKLYRSFTLKHILFPFKLAISIRKVKKIFRDYHAEAFIGCGGFVSAPSGFVAKGKKIPYFLQEQNSYPGLTTRALEESAKKVFIGQKDAQKYLKNAHVVYSGNPINKELVQSNRLADLRDYNFSQDKKTIFLIGGSQGSQFLNKMMDSIIDELLQKYNVIWQLGVNNLDEFSQKHKNKAGLFMFGFSYDIDALYNVADIAICRAGAITIAELEAKTIPAILIPLPSAAENHQYRNAMEQTEKKIAVTLSQNNLDFKTLLVEIEKLSDNYFFYKSNFDSCVHLKAVDTIVNSILESLNKE